MLSAPVPILSASQSHVWFAQEEFHADIFRSLISWNFCTSVYQSRCIIYIYISYHHTKSIQESWSRKHFRSFNTVLPAFNLTSNGCRNINTSQLAICESPFRTMVQEPAYFFSNFRKCPLSWHHQYIHGISPTLHVGSAPSKWWDVRGAHLLKLAI